MHIHEKSEVEDIVEAKVKAAVPHIFENSIISLTINNRRLTVVLKRNLLRHIPNFPITECLSRNTSTAHH